MIGNLCAQPQQITPVFKLSVSIYYMMCKKKFLSFCLQYDKVLQCIYLFIYFFTLLVLVLPYNNMHLPLVYTCSPSWTPLLPPSPYHPSGSSKCTIPKLSVSCIEPGLVIHFLYDIIQVDETGAYYTEWSKPERKTPIQYTNAYIWNLERW